MQEISSLPEYTGIVPNKATQNDYDFANNIFGFINYNGNVLIPEINQMVIALNILSDQMVAKKEEIYNNLPDNGGYSQAFIDAKLILAGEIKAIYSRLAGTYTIPASGVVDANGYMYCNGAAIPSGYGMSGTVPNLTDGRFLRGSTLVGQAGSDTITITIANLPEHGHDFSTNTSSSGSHYHTGTTDSQGGHAHSASVYNEGAVVGQSGIFASSGGYARGATAYTSTEAAHGHNLSTNTTANHQHTVSGTTSNIGNGTAITHVPKYVDVKYIIKVK